MRDIWVCSDWHFGHISQIVSYLNDYIHTKGEIK